MSAEASRGIRKQSLPPTREEMAALHKYFICADAARVRFDEQLAAIKSPVSDLSEKVIQAKLALLVWYGLLFVVVEGWGKLRLRDQEITPLLRSRNRDLLRECRASVFHYSPQYFDDRFVKLIMDGTGVAAWTKTLHWAMSRYLLDWVRAQNQAERMAGS